MSSGRRRQAVDDSESSSSAGSEQDESQFVSEESGSENEAEYNSEEGLEYDEDQDGEEVIASGDPVDDSEVEEDEEHEEEDVEDEEEEEVEDEEEDGQDEEDEDEEEEGVDEGDEDMEEQLEEESPNLGDDDDDNFAQSHLTDRQRARKAGQQLPSLSELPEVDIGGRNSKKKILSVEEQRIKRAELARRRRNLSLRRLEEEKQGTLDKLLKRRAGRTQRSDSEEPENGTRKLTLSRLHPVHPALTSWVSKADGSFTLSMTAERAAVDGIE